MHRRCSLVGFFSSSRFSGDSLCRLSPYSSLCIFFSLSLLSSSSFRFSYLPVFSFSSHSSLSLRSPCVSSKTVRLSRTHYARPRPERHYLHLLCLRFPLDKTSYRGEGLSNVSFETFPEKEKKKVTYTTSRTTISFCPVSIRSIFSSQRTRHLPSSFFFFLWNDVPVLGLRVCLFFPALSRRIL